MIAIVILHSIYILYNYGLSGAVRVSVPALSQTAAASARATLQFLERFAWREKAWWREGGQGGGGFVLTAAR